MAGTSRVAGGRPVTVATKLSKAEEALLDGMRGPLRRADFVRAAILEKCAREAGKAPVDLGRGPVPATEQPLG